MVFASRGADFGDVRKTTIYTANIDTFRASAGIRRECGKLARRPPGTLMQIGRPARPVPLGEIEATAIAPD